MDILEKKQHFIILFDFYEDLLTEKQQKYFKDYYFEDLSLSEIAVSYGISRNAVFDQLNKVYKSLEEYEDKLGLYTKFEQRQKIYNELEELKCEKVIDKKVFDLIEKLRKIE